MQGIAKLDWSRMLGFEQVADLRSTVRTAKLGAKVGGKVGVKAGIKN